MATRRKSKVKGDDIAGILTDILIVQLFQGGVQQQTIRKILGCDINRVSRITKHMKAARKAAANREQS